MGELKAYTIPEFCAAFRISRGTFYNLLKAKLGPRTMKIGARVLVSFEAADEWRRAREAAAERDLEAA